MKNIFIIGMAAFFTTAIVSCDIDKLQKCKSVCDAAKNTCYDKAKDKTGKMSDTKKAICDKAYKVCADTCDKQFKEQQAK